MNQHIEAREAARRKFTATQDKLRQQIKDAHLLLVNAAKRCADEATTIEEAIEACRHAPRGEAKLYALEKWVSLCTTRKELHKAQQSCRGDLDVLFRVHPATVKLHKLVLEQMREAVTLRDAKEVIYGWGWGALNDGEGRYGPQEEQAERFYHEAHKILASLCSSEEDFKSFYSHLNDRRSNHRWPHSFQGRNEEDLRSALRERYLECMEGELPGALEPRQ